MVRFLLVFLVLFGLSACNATRDLDEAPVALGDFKLGHNVVVASKAQMGPLSRRASEDEIKAAMTGALADRFGRYAGDGLYHFGVSVEGYVLAAPGVPLVVSPKSVMIINLTVWSDELNKKLNEKPEQIAVIESFGSGAFIGSGYTLSADEQLTQLSENAAKAIERYLVENHKNADWFVPGAAPQPPYEAPDEES